MSNTKGFNKYVKNDYLNKGLYSSTRGPYGDVIKRIPERILRLPKEYISVWEKKKTADSLWEGSKSTIMKPSENTKRLSENDLNSLNVNGPLIFSIMGKGETPGPYGTGPSRDLRRAILTPLFMCIIPQAQIATRVFGVQTVSEPISFFLKDLEKKGFSASSFSYSSEFFTLTRDSFDPPVYIKLFNITKKGNWPAVKIYADVLVGTYSFVKDGSDFVPSELKCTSPFFGHLSSILDAEKNKEIGLNIEKWFSEKISQLSSIIKNALPQSLPRKDIKALVVDNL